MSKFLRKIGKDLKGESKSTLGRAKLTPITSYAGTQEDYEKECKKESEKLNTAGVILCSKEYIVIDWLTHNIQRFTSYNKAVCEYDNQIDKDNDTDVELMVVVKTYNNVDGKQRRAK